MLILFLLASSVAWGATLQVGETGPLRTIQSAINSARAGDTIVIHAGTYRETVRVTGDGLTIAAAPGEEVIITGADLIPAAEWVREPDKPVWRHTHWTYHGPRIRMTNFIA
jgi:hypothetical protein